jgi:hypothetical protein
MLRRSTTLASRRVLCIPKYNASVLSKNAMSTSTAPLKNVLAQSKSPYLLQHKDNPVAVSPPFSTLTYANGVVAGIHSQDGSSSERARQADLSVIRIFSLSLVCLPALEKLRTRCHVLAHESFENDEIAKIMNEYFVNIKIDREERPDVDRMYMTFLQVFFLLRQKKDVLTLLICRRQPEVEDGQCQYVSHHFLGNR